MPVVDFLSSPRNTRNQRIDFLNKNNDRLAALTARQGNEISHTELDNPEPFIRAEIELATQKAAQNEIPLLTSRENFRIGQINSIAEIHKDLGVLIAQAQNNNVAGVIGVDIQGKQLLARLSSVLNQKFIGEYTLSGVDVETAPTIDLTTLLPTTENSPDYSYYTGGNPGGVVELGGFSLLINPVTAAHPAVEKLIRALQMTMNFPVTTNENQSLDNAFKLYQEIEKTDLPDMQMTASMNKFTMIKEELLKKEGQLMEFLGSEKITNLAKLFEELQSQKTTLEISQLLAFQEQQDLRRFAEELKR